MTEICPSCNEPLDRQDTCRIVGDKIIHARCPDPVPDQDLLRVITESVKGDDKMRGKPTSSAKCSVCGEPFKSSEYPVFNIQRDDMQHERCKTTPLQDYLYTTNKKAEKGMPNSAFALPVGIFQHGIDHDDKVDAFSYAMKHIIAEATISKNPLRVSISNNGTRYTLLDDVLFEAFGILIRDGFVTDFASTPKWLWMIYPPTGFYQRAALLHDYLYQHGAERYGHDREFCDWIFREQMKLDGVGVRTRWTFWLAVRLFGAKWWRAA